MRIQKTWSLLRSVKGKLIEKRVRREKRIEIRDPSGRLLRIETVRLTSGPFSSLPIHKFGQKGIHHVLSSF